jgi:ankyrin repeat protein
MSFLNHHCCFLYMLWSASGWLRLLIDNQTGRMHCSDTRIRRRSHFVCATAFAGRSRHGRCEKRAYLHPSVFFSSAVATIPNINYAFTSQRRGFTALICAARCGHVECVELLLEAGANARALDNVRAIICDLECC